MTQDLLLPFATGISGLNGYILKSEHDKSNNYSFTSGFVTSYSSRCSVGGLPEIEVGISVLGDIGNLDNNVTAADFTTITGTSPISGLNFKLANFSTIDLELDDFQFDRLLNYELNISANRNPLYAIGTNSALNVEIDYPIEVTFDCNLEIVNFSGQKLSDFPCSPRVKNLRLALNDFVTREPYITYQFSDLILIGQNYSAGINNNVSLNLQYKTYLTRAMMEYAPDSITTTTTTTNTTTTSTRPTLPSSRLSSRKHSFH